MKKDKHGKDIDEKKDCLVIYKRCYTLKTNFILNKRRLGRVQSPSLYRERNHLLKDFLSQRDWNVAQELFL